MVATLAVAFGGSQNVPHTDRGLLLLVFGAAVSGLALLTQPRAGDVARVRVDVSVRTAVLRRASSVQSRFRGLLGETAMWVLLVLCAASAIRSLINATGIHMALLPVAMCAVIGLLLFCGRDGVVGRWSFGALLIGCVISYCFLLRRAERPTTDHTVAPTK